MGYSTLVRFGQLLILLVVQVLLLNHMHLFGYVTPVIIGYLVVRMDTSVSRMAHLLWGFAVGLLFDLFSNTAGMGAATCTLLAMVKPYLLRLFMPRDVVGAFRPTVQSLTLSRYAWYVLSCMGLFHVTFYLLEAFTLSNIWLTIAAMVGGTLVSSVVIVCFEYIRHGRPQEREVKK